MLKHGDNPDEINLNPAINGTGIVRVDDIRLMKDRLNCVSGIPRTHSYTE